MLPVPPRSHEPEIMDRHDNSREALEGALRNIGTVNRWLGGRRTLLGALRPLVRAFPAGTEISLLDLGTGGADLPVAMERLARQLGRRMRITAVDNDPVTVGIAARAVADRPSIRIVRADAMRLTFPDRSFDLVTASMFLHHFRQADVVHLLRSMRRLARVAALVNDLRRHWVAWGFITLAARLSRRHPMFVHDAPLSVLRGFTDTELREAAAAAGVPSADLRRRWPFRLLLTLPAP